MVTGRSRIDASNKSWLTGWENRTFGGMARLARRSLAWFRPDFHPWDLDDEGLLERWASEERGALGGGMTR